MDTTVQTPPVEQALRNPQTEALHRREVFWQITVPLMIGGVIFAAFVILTIIANASLASQGADVALIWLLILPILMTLLVFVILAAMVYGLWKLLALLPGKMYQVQNIFQKIQAFVRMASDKLVEPFLKVHSTSASVGAFWHSLFKKGS
jgi:hypothetical protein